NRRDRQHVGSRQRDIEQRSSIRYEGVSVRRVNDTMNPMWPVVGGHRADLAHTIKGHAGEPTISNRELDRAFSTEPGRAATVVAVREVFILLAATHKRRTISRLLLIDSPEWDYLCAKWTQHSVCTPESECAHAAHAACPPKK